MIFKGCGSPKLVADLGSTPGGPSTGFMMERLTNMKAFQSKANLPHADSRNYTGLNIFGEGGGAGTLYKERCGGGLVPFTGSSPPLWTD